MRTIFGWPIRSDAGVLYTPVLSGGSWLTALPLANLQDGDLSKVARSADAALASTIIKADLGVVRSIRLAALVKHNLSSAARWRARLSTAEMVNVCPNSKAPASWTSILTPVITTGIADPWGTTAAILVEDNDAVSTEGKEQNTTFTGDGVKLASFTVRAGTAPVIRLTVHDASVPAARHQVSVTWGVGSAAPALATLAGAGSISTPVAAYDATGTLWWIIRFTTDGVVAANTNQLRALAGTLPGDTGTFYLAGAEAFNLTSDPVTHDSGWQGVWPSGIDAEEYEGHVPTALDVLGAAVSARYALIEIGDTANSDGYVHAGRLAICGGYEPTYHYAPGKRLGVEDRSEVEDTDGAGTIKLVRTRKKTAEMTFENTPLNESLAYVLEMQLKLGITGQFFVALDPDDTTNMHRQSFLCRMKELNALEAHHYERNHVSFALLEER